MINIKYINMRLDRFIPLLTAILLISSCSKIDERDFADERYYTSSHASAVSSAGGSTGLVALDASILSYLMAGESGTDEFGLKAVDIAFDLRSNDLDMDGSTWFGGYHRYDNVVPNSGNTEHLWEFFYKVINQANGIINTIPDDSPEEILVYKYKSYTYRAIAYFYLIRIFQHTNASNSSDAIPIDFGDFVGESNSTVGEVKQVILDDLTEAYNGLQGYSRSSKEEIDATVVAAFLARFHLTYENWTEAERFALEAMSFGNLSNDVAHGFDEISLSEAIWGSVITAQTTTFYRSFFSHMSQISDGYSGWNHFKTINSKLYDLIPSTDERKKWFAGQDYDPGVVIVPGSWDHYNFTPKYTMLKFWDGPTYGNFVGDYIYLRNAEFYLTRAEALARLGREDEAQQLLYDLNTTRDPGYVKSGNTGQALIDEIILYRRIELFGEGVASFDMARLGIGLDRQDGRLNPLQPGADITIPAGSDKMIFPIPTVEIDAQR
jgi:starch-binding outer membrane protein, SusD/RagB family